MMVTIGHKLKHFILFLLALSQVFLGTPAFGNGNSLATPPNQEALPTTEDAIDKIASALADEDISLPEELKALKETSVDINDLSFSESKESLEKLMKIKFDGDYRPGKVPVFYLAYRALILGHNKELKTTIQDLVDRLSMPGDPELKVMVGMSASPASWVDWDKGVLVFNIGTFGFAKDLDEVAAFLAVTLERVKYKKKLQASNRSANLDKIDSIVETRDIEPTQQEWLRADLKAIDRLIHAKYNPNAIYNIYKRLSKIESTPWEYRIGKWLFRGWNRLSEDFYASAPLFAIRMASVKGYLTWRQEQVDLYDLVIKKNKFSRSMGWLHKRLWIYQLPKTSFWYKRTTAWAARAASIFAMYVTYKAGMNMLARSSAETASDTPVESDPLEFEEEKKRILEDIFNNVGGWIEERAPEGVSDIYWKGIEGLGFIGDLKNSATQYIVENGESIFLLGTLSICGVTLAGLFTSSFVKEFKDAMASDPVAYSKLKLMVSFSHKIANLIPRIKGKSAKDQVNFLPKLIELSVSRLTASYDLYLHVQHIRSWKLFDGLTFGTMRSVRNLSELINLTLKMLETLEPVEAQATWEQVAAQLEKLPAFAFEKPFIKRSLRAFSEYSKKWRAFDIMEKKEGDLIGEKPNDRYRWERTWRQLSYNRLIDKRASISTTAHLILSLKEFGAVDTARKLFSKNRKAVLNFIFSTENTNTELPSEYAALIKYFKMERTLKPAGYFIRRFQENGFLREVIRGSRAPEEKTAVKSLSLQVPAGWPWFLRVRGLLNRGNTRKFRQELKGKFNTVSELVEFIDRELVSRNAIMDSFSLQLVKLISENPMMLKTTNDIELLLNRDYFWPKLGSTGSEPGHAESVLMDSIYKMRDQYPNVWLYEPSKSEVYHQLVIDHFKTNGLWQEDSKWKLSLWEKLVKKGVTSITDDLFLEIYSESKGQQILELERKAIKEGWVWEPTVKGRLAENIVFRSQSYKKLLTESNPTKRMTLLRETINYLREQLPERGFYYGVILEKISNVILSSSQESALIHEAKTKDLKQGKDEDKNKKKDLGLRILSDILGDALNWRKANQWAFIKFLIGREEPNRKVRNSFKTIGPERVRRMFQLLPLYERAILLDTFLDSNTGLMPSGKITRGYGKKILDHLLEGHDDQTSDVTKKILRAFFYGLEKVGNKNMGTYILSYVMSMPQADNQSSGHVLKNCLEIIGLTGVKLAQILAASEILGPEDSAILRGAQEKANEPDREDIHQDIRDIFGKSEVPFWVRELLGAASVKYTIKGIDKKTSKEIAVKIFRKSAFTKARQQFRILELMSEYLVKEYGSDYSVVDTIVDASINAVKKELSAKSEVQRSQVARLKLYRDRSNDTVGIIVPYDSWVHERLISAEFAEGTSIYDPEISEESRVLLSETILSIESEILFSNDEVILFEPDRHAGNYRVKVKIENGKKTMDVYVIDFGQLTSISRVNRDRVFQLFAVSQIVKVAGVSSPILYDLAETFGMSEAQVVKLEKSMGDYFPNQDMSETTAFFSVLTALKTSGVKIEPEFISFFIAILQLKPYETILSEYEKTTGVKSGSPRVTEVFEAKVRDYASQLEKKLISEMGVSDGLKVIWNMAQSGEMTYSEATQKIWSEGKKRLGLVDTPPESKVHQEQVIKGQAQQELVENNNIQESIIKSETFSPSSTVVDCKRVVPYRN